MKNPLRTFTLLLVTSIAAAAFLGVRTSATAQGARPGEGIQVISDIAYKTGDHLTDYEKQQCKLDLYLPSLRKGFATMVWFHGGNLTGGDKEGEKAIGESLAKGGIAFVSANYQFSPKVKYPTYIDDAAAAFVWTRSHVAEHGGDPGKVFISGASAGGYLALMVGLDERYLRKLGTDLSAVAGIIPVSGQVMTHYTVREERGIGMFTITADEAAPVYYCRKDTPPMLVLYADHDMAARAEENEYLVATLKGAGNQRVTGRLITDRDHASIAARIANEADPARLAIIDFITTQTAQPPLPAINQPVQPTKPLTQ